MTAHRASPIAILRWGHRAALATILLLCLAGSPVSGHAARAAHLNAAGLVIRHGDGSVLYFYVRFSEPEITGTQLLQRSGVSIDVSPYAGLGQAVCRIDGEGCPSTNCFCKSYANPSVYWRYHMLSPEGTWLVLPYGPDHRTIHDGDVDGWSWSARNNDLPNVTLSQIARITNARGGATPAPTAADVRASPPGSPSSERQPAASPVVLGVDVKPSGATSIATEAVARRASSNRTYLWFGAGLGVLILAGLAAVVRRQRASR